MSIISQYIFDNDQEVDHNSFTEVITKVDDPSLANPFVSGTTLFSGTVDGVSTGYVTPASFMEVVSGSPWVSSGEAVTFDFGTVRTLHSITIGQTPGNYAVAYVVSGDSQALIRVDGSTNSGTIVHKFAAPVETRTVTVGVTKINPFTSGTAYSYQFTEVSGSANLTFVDSDIETADLASLTATSVVEPVENLFDDDTLTFWQSNNSYPQTVTWHFTNFENLSRFHYFAEDLSTYPTQFTLASSIDGSTYTTILTRDGTNPVTSGELLADFVPVVTAKFLKWTINAGVGAKVRIKNVFLTRRSYPQVDLNIIRMKKIVSNGFVNPLSLTASSQSGSAVVSNIVSTDSSKYWNSGPNFVFNSSTGTYTGSETILVDLGTAKTLDSVSWVNRDGFGVPVDFQVEGSSDNITYSVVERITGNALRSADLKYYDSVNTYRFYRLNFTNSTASSVRIHHAEMNIRTYPAEASVKIPELLVDVVSNYDVSGSIPFPAADIKYILDVDGKNYWHNGSTWTVSDGTLANSNTISTLNSKLSTLDGGENFRIALVPVFQSDTTDTAVIESVTAKVTNHKNSEFIPQNLIRIRGFLTGFPGNVKKPIEIQVNLLRSVISVGGQTLGSAVQTFQSDSTGYFDFELPQTENAVPTKARWAIKIPMFNFRTEQYTPALTELSLSNWIGGNF